MFYRLNKYLLHYNIFISMCAVALVLYFSTITNQKVSPIIYTMTFFGTLGVYNLFRLYPTFQDYFQHKNLRTYKLIFFSFIFSGVCYLLLPLNLKILYCIPVLLSLSYKFPIIFNKDLRSIPFIKVFIIASVWIVIGAGPILLSPEQTHTHLYLRMLSQFLFFISITLPFDVFDANKDRIQTFATKMGNTKAIGIAMTCLFAHLILACLISNNHKEMAAHCIISIITFFILINYQKLTSRKWQFYCVDGTIILQTIIILWLH